SLIDDILFKLYERGGGVSRIDLGRGSFEQRHQFFRISRGANHEVDVVESGRVSRILQYRELSVRHIELRLRFDLTALLADFTDDTDDLTRLVIVEVQMNLLSNRIFVRPEQFRHRLID